MPCHESAHPVCGDERRREHRLAYAASRPERVSHLILWGCAVTVAESKSPQLAAIRRWLIRAGAFDGHRRSATVTAVAPTHCLALMHSDLLAELRNNRDPALKMLQVMSRRVRDLDERLSH